MLVSFYYFTFYNTLGYRSGYFHRHLISIITHSTKYCGYNTYKFPRSPLLYIDVYRLAVYQNEVKTKITLS